MFDSPARHIPFVRDVPAAGHRGKCRVLRFSRESLAALTLDPIAPHNLPPRVKENSAMSRQTQLGRDRRDAPKSGFPPRSWYLIPATEMSRSCRVEFRCLRL